MDDNIEQLSETFAAHEYLAPNAGDVLEKANAIARTYCRRRIAARATGASVLGAGLVAGGIALPRLHWTSDSDGVAVGQAASGGGAPALFGTTTGGATLTPSPSPMVSGAPPASPSAPSASLSSSVPASPRAYNEQQELDAYFADGYDYDNAVQLSALWNQPDIETVKAAAGLKLLQGETLPVFPSGTPETAQQQALDAYFAGGYDYNDALTLGTLWHETDMTQIKTEAGQQLIEGQTLPIAPSTPTTPATPTPETAAESASDAAQSAAWTAYFAHGYTYNDALTLGTLWHETDTDQIKAEAGQKLLDGQTLPIAPTPIAP
jgi:hypothetical protein